ncbi:squalene/phytoene synthase family protein, partial [Chloroflexota bacterium]
MMANRTADLARKITRTSSIQSFFTAQLMVDRDLEDDCFRAYGYFRWVDDMVDIECQTKADRLSFIQRQKNLVEICYCGEKLADLTLEEEVLVDLIRNDRGVSIRLQSYIRNFLAIIEFDAERKGRLITQSELDWYASTLGKAVTDGIQYFVCNSYSYPESEKRYLAATGAHITHMLRDMAEDIQSGYFNIPVETIEIVENNFQQFENPVIRKWVKDRVQLARQYFAEGKQYLDDLPVLRCRIVGYWYCERFEFLLDKIVMDAYVLRSRYRKPNIIFSWMKFVGIALEQTWRHAIFHIQNRSGLCGWSQSQVD